MDTPEDPEEEAGEYREEYLDEEDEVLFNFADPLQVDYDIESLNESLNPMGDSTDLIDEPSTSQQAPVKKKVGEWFLIIL